MASLKIVRRIGGITSNTDATSYLVLSSLSPAASGAKLYCAAATAFGTTPAQPTLSGTNAFSGTWTAELSATIGSNRRLTVFSSTAQSTTAGNLTLSTGGGETDLGCVATVVEMGNQGAQTPVQSKSNTGSAATSLTVTFDNAFGSVWNGVLGFFFIASATAQDITLGDNMTTDRSATLSTADVGTIRAIFAPANLSAPAVSFASNNAIGICLELAQDGSDISAAVSQTTISPAIRV